VLELYNYVIDRTKGSLSEQNKLELAKRLTDPSIRRKAMGDF
jgi:phenylpyruvate tautomerase PptA (4-oxalocrotonate tautomerase family)